MRRIVISTLIFGLFHNATSMANSLDAYDVGFKDAQYELFNFYDEKTPTGSYIKKTFEDHVKLRTNEIPFENLPESFNPLIDIVHAYVLGNSKQKLEVVKNEAGKIRYEKDSNNFYSGPNGEKNGVGFRFNKEELPTRIVRLAFCFGIDPLIYTSLLNVESKFSKSAKSPTGASGFSQLTDKAIAEVSEQLDIIGPDYRTKNSVEFLNQAIDCYYGPNKKWSNIWEDQVVPRGKAAYLNSELGGERQWRYITKSKEWLNADPDRNLVYGAIYFKTVLSRRYNRKIYSRALKEYNVGEKEVYLKRIQGFYGDLAPDLIESLGSGENNQGRFSRIAYKELVMKFGDKKCVIPSDDSSWILPVFGVGLYPKDEISQAIVNEWVKAGRCQDKNNYM